MQREEELLFTVIVLVYNNQQYLKECLDSILNQDYPYIEIIIADDHSNQFDVDAHMSYICENNKGNIHKYIAYSNPENYGTVKNINEALKKRKGKFIKLLAADDSLYDSKVLSNAKMGLEQTEHGMIISKVVICDPNMVPTGKGSKYDQKKLGNLSSVSLFKKLCKTNVVDTQGVFLSNVFFEKYGKFNEDYLLLEDWPKWMEFSLLGGTLKYCDFVACNYRSDCGVGTGVNPLYLQDKQRAFSQFVKKNKKDLGIINYQIARGRFILTTSVLIRKLYGVICRK